MTQGISVKQCLFKITFEENNMKKHTEAQNDTKQD